MVTDLLQSAGVPDVLAQSQIPETPLVEQAPLPLWIMATVHVLTATVWLGLDAAVVGAALLVRRHDLDLDVRVTFERLRRWLELGPWATVILSVPLVLTLVWMNGYGLADLHGNTFVSLSGYAAVWLAAVVFVVATDLSSPPLSSPPLKSPQDGPGAGGPQRAAVLNRVDSVLRLLVASVFFALGVLALRTPTIFYNPKYAWKAIVFALVVALGWWARQAGRGISENLAIIAARARHGGSAHPDGPAGPGGGQQAEAALRRQIDRMLIPAILSWVGIVVAVGLSVTG